MAVGLGLVTLTLTIDMPTAGQDDGPASAAAEVAPKVEVRGRQPDPSDGRSTRSMGAASGLTRTAETPDPPDPRGIDPLPPAASDPALAPAATLPEPEPEPAPAEAPPERPVAPERSDPPESARQPGPADQGGSTARPEPEPEAPPSAPADPEPPPAEPQPTPAGPEPRSAEALRAAALAHISYPWASRLPGWTIVFDDDGGTLRGVTLSGPQRIEIHMRPGDSAWDLARVLAHELGHAVDLAYNDTGDRRAWKQARGIDAEAPWWPTSGAADFATGAGDFAECFATWQVGSGSLSRLAGACSAADLALVRQLSR